MSKRIAIYVRVSTHEQSPQLQERELLAFARCRGWKVTEVYSDQVSGTTLNRPALRRLLKDVRSRRVDLVLCWKLDRLFRSLKDLIGTLQEFSELGVEFVSLKDNIDLTTSSGRLLMHILGAFGEFEAALIRERVRAGLANARANGKRLGRPRCRDDEKILQLRRDGMSLREIAQRLGVSKSTVHDAVRGVQKCPSGQGGNPQ